MAGSNTGGVKVDQDSEYPTQSTADMPAFVQNLLVQMQNRFEAMSEGILLKIEEMRSKIGELEQTVNDLKAEIEVEDAAKPKPQEDKPSHDSA